MEIYIPAQPSGHFRQRAYRGFLMHPNRMAKKYPMYQIDWLGYLLLKTPKLPLTER
ncbi:MAG: hypothetical protein QM669_09115 [Siphonobacter sp.]